jgi:hypothetical protein
VVGMMAGFVRKAPSQNCIGVMRHPIPAKALCDFPEKSSF